MFSAVLVTIIVQVQADLHDSTWRRKLAEEKAADSAEASPCIESSDDSIDWRQGHALQGAVGLAGPSPEQSLLQWGSHIVRKELSKGIVAIPSIASIVSPLGSRIVLYANLLFGVDTGRIPF